MFIVGCTLNHFTLSCQSLTGTSQTVASIYSKSVLSRACPWQRQRQATKPSSQPRHSIREVHIGIRKLICFMVIFTRRNSSAPTDRRRRLHVALLVGRPHDPCLNYIVPTNSYASKEGSFSPSDDDNDDEWIMYNSNDHRNLASLVARRIVESNLWDPFVCYAQLMQQ